MLPQPISHPLIGQYIAPVASPHLIPLVPPSDFTVEVEPAHEATSRLEELAINQLDRASLLLNSAATTLELSDESPVLSVIIPAFNEMKTIAKVVEAVARLDVSKQIIMVDDGSTDGTREWISQWNNQRGITVCLHPKNQGKGAAIQSGIQLAKGDIVIVQDADLEYEPEDILNVIRPILDGESDVVYGSRYLGNAEQDPSRLHRFGNAVLTGFSNWMMNQRLSDMETCYKAFKRELLQKIRIEQKRFGFEPEITAKLARRGIVIREVPIRYKSRSWKEGKKIGVKDLINTLWCIVRYRYAK
jgi:glycosyltransferase involved in cell wall biosynthesis